MNIFSHNGIVTVKNPVTGNHRTFRIHTVKKGNLTGKRILSILIGPDNENDYLPIAFVGDKAIHIWKKYQLSQYERVALSLLKIEKFGFEVNFDGKCRVCNRTLTTPDSVELGIGPECRKKIHV